MGRKSAPPARGRDAVLVVTVFGVLGAVAGGIIARVSDQNIFDPAFFTVVGAAIGLVLGAFGGLLATALAGLSPRLGDRLDVADIGGIEGAYCSGTLKQPHTPVRTLMQPGDPLALFRCPLCAREAPQGEWE